MLKVTNLTILQGMPMITTSHSLIFHLAVKCDLKIHSFRTQINWKELCSWSHNKQMKSSLWTTS